jgi:hypothetical protein
MGSWIRIGGKSAPKRRKSKEEDQKKDEKFLCGHILGKEFGLKMFNVRKIRRKKILLFTFGKLGLNFTRIRIRTGSAFV